VIDHEKINEMYVNAMSNIK